MKNLEQAARSSGFRPTGAFNSGVAFVTAEIASRADVADRQSRLAEVVAQAIIPRLMLIHNEVLAPPLPDVPSPTDDEIAQLARLVLGPDIHAAANYMMEVKQRGLSLEVLFVELLEPAARYLGKMWDDDRCDFIDVTLGVARLQELLAIFNETHGLPALSEKRRVLLMTTAGEQHRFGIAMVEKFLRAAGWQVRSETGITPESLATLVRSEWFAVAGITLSRESELDVLAGAIKAVREYSCNPSIGIMVGGPAFIEHPEFVARSGADGAAANAPTAVLLAQKLFDIGAAEQVSASNKT